MAVPKQHRSKSRQGQRRQHIYLKDKQKTLCSKCAKPVLPHILCENCGHYKGREMVDVFAKLNKKERKAKAKEIAVEKQEGGKKELSMEELSKKT